ncbi:MAG: ATP-dependent helicase [Archaeoglobaceae archaeon]
MIVKVFGAPGTGKTTKLIQDLSNFIKKEKVKTSDVCVISFSNSAVEEIATRTGFVRRSKVTPYFSTLHGICLKLGMEYDENFKNRAKKTFTNPFFVEGWLMKFFRQIGVPYEPDQVASEALGNRAMAQYSRAVGCYYPIYRDVWKCVEKIEDETLHWIVVEWLKFKEKNGIIDYEDMLIVVFENKLVPQVKVIFIDEFQDLTPLEYEIISLWIEKIPCVFVYGDDDQCIHQWRGCDPRFLLDLKADEVIILSKSWRVPSEVLNFAMKLISGVKKRKHKEIVPAYNGGKVIFTESWNFEILVRNAISLAEKVKNRNETVFLLLRTNRMVRAVEEILYDLAYPFRKLKGESLWDKELTTAWNVFAKLKTKKYALDTAEAEWLLDHLNPIFTEQQKEAIKNNLKRGIFPLDFFGKFGVDQIDPETMDRRIYEIAIKAREPITPRSMNLYVDTMHASKGRECDYCFVADALTPTIRDEVLKYGVDSELRLYYTATTRAKRAVIFTPIAGFTHLLNFVSVSCGGVRI